MLTVLADLIPLLHLHWVLLKLPRRLLLPSGLLLLLLPRPTACPGITIQHDMDYIYHDMGGIRQERFIIGGYRCSLKGITIELQEWITRQRAGTHWRPHWRGC